ncbi:MAG: AmmeMemoRadiSam system protein B [Vicinamibacterales bacterium]
MTGKVRTAAVAGTWYPGTASALAAAVDGQLAVADAAALDVRGDLVALIAPHAGLMYSGPVAAHAYRLLRDRPFDVAVLVGPSHFVGFAGVALFPSGGFETPFGVTPIDAACGRAIAAASDLVHDRLDPHVREHSLEMQLPFLARLAPALPIVPLLMGYQTAATAAALGDALAVALQGRQALLIASSDLSHYHDAVTASALDRVVVDCVAGFDVGGLQDALDQKPEHACGGGPMVAVMRAARAVGARDAVILDHADSGDVSGDKSSVVGYLAAALGNFKPTTAETVPGAHARLGWR